MTIGIVAANVRAFLGYILNPVALLFFSVLVLSIYLMCRSRATKKIGMVLFGIWIGLYAVSTYWLPHQLVSYFEQQYVRVQAVNPKVHWVVVLGGGAAKNSHISPSDALSSASLRRLLEGVRLYRQLPEAKLILSGAGTAAPAHTVAKRMAAMADTLDIPRANQVLEADSINTKDEARLIQPLVENQPFYLVTSAVHMPRAMKLFEELGMHPIAAPCDYLYVASESRQDALRYLNFFIPSEVHITRFNAVWHEYLGLLWGIARDHVKF